ncbi:sphingosine kinase 1-like [Silene latifolia]|uniref:sphingosine kinase 1-like n=1 Tax=Silene latifolia TaxID=37657 RepID=UPI003D775FA5
MNHPPFKNPTIILSDDVTTNGTLTPLTFFSDGTLRWTDATGEKRLILEKEVLGVSMEGCTIILRSCTVEQGGSGGILCLTTTQVMVRKIFVFQLPQDSVTVWFRKIREFLNSLGRPKRLLILVNPYGGQKTAMNILVDIVKPLLEDAETEFKIEETKYQLHAKQIASELDLTMYDGIVCVSGDGVLVEVINGLLQRDDWKTAIKMPLGPIPAGTGNGVAKSVLDSVGEPCSATNATLAILRGHKRSLDVTTISQGKTRFFSVLMLAWGLVADIDIESEKWRWMGSARLDLYAIQRILNLRKYNGRIHFVPASGFEEYARKISEEAVSSAKDLAFCSSSNIDDGAHEKGYVGPDLNLEKLDWRTIEGPFISVWIHNVPWGSESAMPAPDAKFSDGFVDVVLVKDGSKLGLLSLMTEHSNGNHVKSPHVLYFKVKAFILEPGTRTSESTKEGIIDSDGEVLARGKGAYKCNQKTLMSYDKMVLTVDQALATLFSPPT